MKIHAKLCSFRKLFTRWASHRITDKHLMYRDGILVNSNKYFDSLEGVNEFSKIQASHAKMIPLLSKQMVPFCVLNRKHTLDLWISLPNFSNLGVNLYLINYQDNDKDYIHIRRTILRFLYYIKGVNSLLRYHSTANSESALLEEKKNPLIMAEGKVWVMSIYLSSIYIYIFLSSLHLYFFFRIHINFVLSQGQI